MYLTPRLHRHVEEAISGEKAEAIARALDQPVSALFNLSKSCKPLSNKTVLEYHRFIHTVLRQAEKEMLVPYNAAAKASPPSCSKQIPNYFQPEEITAILDALEEEPEKWRVLTHLLIVTGCRRGEIAGLKWSHVDLNNHRLEISSNLLYSKSWEFMKQPPRQGHLGLLIFLWKLQHCYGTSKHHRHSCSS